MNPRAVGQYKHSTIFTAITRIKERIVGNPTSYQYLTALDRFLFTACSLLVLHTNHMDNCILAILSWQENQRRRKVSSLERDEFVKVALLWLALPSVERKAAHLKDLHLDRAVLSDACRQFVAATQSYVLAGHGQLTCEDVPHVSIEAQLAYRANVEEAFGASGNMNAMIAEIVSNMEDYEQFAGAILEKYYRLVGTIAQREYVGVFNAEVDLDDLCQQYLLAARRALDRCDPSQGALTTHIQSQLMTARQRELNNLIAVRKVNGSKSDSEADEAMDPSRNPEEKMEYDQEIEDLRAVARLADPIGYARAYLGIQESRDWILSQFAALDSKSAVNR